MEGYFGLLANAGVEVYIIIGIFITALVTYSVKWILKTRRGVSEPILPQKVVKEKVEEIPKEESEESILGTGKQQCMCFRLGNIIDFTTIPHPVGEVYQFEPSCPISGAGYIVKEQEDGKVVDYDPREVVVKIEQSPEYAWFATHWDIVRTVFSVTMQWWKSPAVWFAAAMMMIVFVSGLVVFD